MCNRALQISSYDTPTKSVLEQWIPILWLWAPYMNQPQLISGPVFSSGDRGVGLSGSGCIEYLLAS